MQVLFLLMKFTDQFIDSVPGQRIRYLCRQHSISTDTFVKLFAFVTHGSPLGGGGSVQHSQSPMIAVNRAMISSPYPTISYSNIAQLWRLGLPFTRE
jgi:hypothetical protein